MTGPRTSNGTEQLASWLEMSRIEMSRTVVRKLIRTTNANRNEGSNDEIIELLEDLSFLLGEPVTNEQEESHDTLSLADRVCALVQPLATRPDVFLLQPDAAGTVPFFIYPNQFQQVLFALLVRLLKEDRPDTVQLSFSHNVGHVLVAFDLNPAMQADSELEELLRVTGASFDGRTLEFPAIARPPVQAATTDLDAIVVTDNPLERQALSRRLANLGVRCHAGINETKIDLCVVADDSSDAFLAIRSQLTDSTRVLLLNNTHNYAQSQWFTVDNPVTQRNLKVHVDAFTNTGFTSQQVLLVDDNDIAVELLKMQLGELGHQVAVTHNGRDAIELAAANTCDLVFMDIQMPGMDGIQATEQIRENNKGLPIIGLTAHATLEEKERCRKAGMNEVLIKPVRMDKLRQLLQPGHPGPARRPLRTGSTNELPIFDRELALRNAAGRIELATEMMALLVENLPNDLADINAASNNVIELRKAVHKLHGAIRYCGVPRLGAAIEKLERALKSDLRNNLENDGQGIELLLNLLNGEVTSLLNWYRDNSNILTLKQQEN